MFLKNREDFMDITGNIYDRKLVASYLLSPGSGLCVMEYVPGYSIEVEVFEWLNEKGCTGKKVEGVVSDANEFEGGSLVRPPRVVFTWGADPSTQYLACVFQTPETRYISRDNYNV